MRPAHLPSYPRTLHPGAWWLWALGLAAAASRTTNPAILLLVLAGRGFGFVLGALTVFAGGLVTGGVGPWLPFQMFGLGWVGFFAGCLPRASGSREVWLLGGYGVVAGLGYGMLLNLWFWPFASYAPELTYVAGAPLAENLHRYLVFWLTTSLGWDVPRGVLSLVLILVAGRPVLRALRRGARRAAFDAPVEFDPAPPRPA
ncbi:MAG: ECF transporter S component [Actinomycetota bacterium]|nr:ECF transporter S component [Actinomycetota bacterium]